MISIYNLLTTLVKVHVLPDKKSHSESAYSEASGKENTRKPFIPFSLKLQLPTASSSKNPSDLFFR